MSYRTIDFSKFSSIKIGPIVDVYEITDMHYPDHHFMIGHANNMLVGPQHPPLMMLSKSFSYIRIENDLLIIGAATPAGKVASFCKKNNIKNLEFLAKLPGSLGGLIKMNAGLKEFEIVNYLHAIKTKNGTILKDEITYGYRFTDICDVIFEAQFKIEEGFSAQRVEMFKSLRDNQPRTSSAGSCFKNPPNDSAGRLIDQAGLKGVQKGAMQFSTMHANFLVNHGGGTFEDAMYLIKKAQEIVYEKFDITLQTEVLIVDQRFIGN